MSSHPLIRVLFLLSLVDATDAFVAQSPVASRSSLSNGSYRKTGSSDSRCFNFLKDALDKAFSNDGSLDKDKRAGQYDDIYAGEEYIESDPSADDKLTDVQRKWRQSTAAFDTVVPEMIAGKSFTLDLFLSGVPDRDPSNDLYGSRVNISSRDKSTGLSLPSAPSASVQLDFLENGECRCSESDFTSGESNGEWKLSDDGKVLRFSMDAIGYTRTVQTKGSIQNVYWTDEEEKSIQTSTTYSIPPGMVYGDVQVSLGRKPGTFEVEKEGVLRLEKSTGMFGIGTQLVACGKFVPKLKIDDAVA